MTLCDLIDQIVDNNHNVRIPRFSINVKNTGKNANTRTLDAINASIPTMIDKIDKQRAHDGYFNQESKDEIALYKDIIKTVMSL